MPASKDGVRLRASELMPAYAESFGRELDQGHADTSLIARYGFLHMQKIGDVRRVLGDLAP
jgi:hypothetical protein